MAALSAGLLPSSGGAAVTAACVIDPQLNHVTINQGMPYTRLVRGKETLLRFYLSLPASIPRCGSTSRSIKIVSATLNVKNGQTVLNPTPIAAQAEAINAEVTNTAPTTKAPAIPANSPADPKFAVPGSVLSAGTTGAGYVASFEATIRYQSKGNDGVFTTDRTRTFTSYIPPGGTTTAISRQVELATRVPRILVVPMGGSLDSAASSAVGAGMSHLSRLFPVADGTNGTSTALRTAELTNTTAGVLRYTVNSGVVSLSSLTDPDGRFCGTSTNFAQIQTQLQGFRNAWNGVVNGVDSPQEQDADKVVGVTPELRSVSSTEGATRGCLEGFAMTNSNESWIRAVANMAGPLFAMEVCHTFGCVADTGTFHSLYTQADTPEPDRAYNVLDRNYISTDRTAMRLITPWTHENTVMEKDHFAYLLCGFGGANTNGCPGAPGTGTLTGVAATSGSAIVMYGTVNKNTNVANVNSMESTGAPLTVADDSSEWRLVQRNASGIVGPPTGYGIPVRFSVSHHGAGGDDHGEDPVGSFNVAFPAEPTATTIELRRNGVATPLYTRIENNAPNIADVSTGGDDVVRLSAWRSTPNSETGATAEVRPSEPKSQRLPRLAPPSGAKVGSVNRRLTKPVDRPTTGRLLYPMNQFGLFGSLGIGRFFATTYVVNTATDPASPDGVCDATQCTLREAITLANANPGLDRIEFTTPGVDAESALPTITDPVTIDGTQADGTPALIEINGGGTGTDINTAGFRVGAGGGGTTIRRLAIVRFPGPGIVLTAGNNVIERNHIGVPIAGTGSGLGNNDGIRVQSSDNTIGGSGDGAGNVIAHNNESGIAVWSGTGNRILGNVAFNNARLGIDLFGCDPVIPPEGGIGVCATGPGVTPNDANDADTTGGNKRQNFPVISSAGATGSSASVSGSLDGDVPDAAYRLEFFRNTACDASGHGEGQTYLGTRTVTSDALGDLVFEESFSGVAVDEFVTATATDPNGNTSEFSACRRVEATGGGGGDTPTFTVNSPNDADDGACTTLHCSLREAINAANAAPTAQTISFAIGTGTQTISPTSALPTISDAVTIDGTTQPGYSGTPIIQLVGNLAPASTSGLTIATGSTTVRGLVIRRFGQHGILITGATSTNNVIVGNYIGTDVSGLEDSGNAREGIRVESPSATIGGTTPAARNVVSGNNGHGILLYGSTGSTVEGNYAGTNAQGAEAIANGLDGVAIDGGSNNIVKNNVASGNANQGIAVFAVDKPTTTGNSVLGNTVGMNAARSAPIANGHDGVRVHNGSNTTIGGTGTGAANVIAHNTDNGIAIFTDKDIDPLSSSTKMAMGNTVSANSIHTNGELGIDLRRDGPTANDVAVGGEGTHDSDQGTNDLQNFPVIRSAVGGTISGDLDSTPSTETTPQDFTITFYASAACDASGFGEGTRFLGTRTVRTSGSGRARFTFTPAAPGVAAGEWVTATATDQDGNTSEFSACRQAIAGEPAPEGTTPVTVSGTDEQPQNTRTFVFANCGGRQEPILVDQPPSETAGTNYWVHFNFDPKPACAGPNGQLVLTVVTTDGFATSEKKTITVSSPNERPFPSIATGGPFVQWDGITLHGYAFDDDEQLPAEKLVWESVGPNLLFSEPKTGFTVPLTRPSPSWTPGNYTVKLTATDSKGLSESVTKTITILGDADHDGWLDESDPNDNDPYDAYKDCDNDGIYNAEEAPGRLCEADLSFAGTATFQPDPLVLPYTGVVTMTMRLLNKNVADVQASSVELKRIDGVTVAGDPAFKATSVAITNTGVLRATFSGQNLSNWLTARPVSYNRRILVTMGGVSKTSPQWSFEGTGSTFVRRG